MLGFKLDEIFSHKTILLYIAPIIKLKIHKTIIWLMKTDADKNKEDQKEKEIKSLIEKREITNQALKKLLKNLEPIISKEKKK